MIPAALSGFSVVCTYPELGMKPHKQSQTGILGDQALLLPVLGGQLCVLLPVAGVEAPAAMSYSSGQSGWMAGKSVLALASSGSVSTDNTVW